MDAPQDRDIELQRESGDLIDELQKKLPPLLWKSRVGNHACRSRPHRWAKSALTDKLIALLEPFQEWPQLLDPHLQGLLKHLTEAFLAYLEKYRDQYAFPYPQIQGDGATYPLPRAICKLLYVLCKVRGVKVISRFLNNEPKYLEPLLRAFIDWDNVISQNPAESSAIGEGQSLIWEERYVMLLWLSHLLLAPFDLASIVSDDIPVPSTGGAEIPNLPSDLPPVALSLISVSTRYVFLPGKEMEAATSLLARLALRPDMRRLGLLNSLVQWTLDILHPDSPQRYSVFGYIGVLSLIARVGTLGQVDDLRPYLVPIFNRVSRLPTDHSHVSSTIDSSAAARKVIIKILRTMTTLALSLEARSLGQISGDQVSRILEDAIDYFLLALSDSYTPVRLAASKALSMITMKLDSELGCDVIDAVIESLDENILYEDSNGNLVSRADAQTLHAGKVKRNTSAVDSQRWHGLILTLAHLLFRRSPPTRQVHKILESLVSGLDFEQRLPTGASLGGNVRDASCFGIWSLARKYNTDELCDIGKKDLKISPHQGEQGILQTLAVELVCAACLDPSGNIRRGASAALQELIGRHPNTVHEGIPLVQVVDYHAVARRSKAMTEVASHAASLGSIYWGPLVDFLLQWRGIGSPDSESRRVAATALGALSIQDSFKSVCSVLHRLMVRLSTLSPNAVELRHGCLLSLAATVDAFLTHRADKSKKNVAPAFANEAALQISRLWEIFDSPSLLPRDTLTLVELRPYLAAEGSSQLLSALARSCVPSDTREALVASPEEKLLQAGIDILMLCISRDGSVPIETSSKAASDLFALLPPAKQANVVQQWVRELHASWKTSTGQGQIAALGAVFQRITSSGPEQQLITDSLLRWSGEEETISKRVSAVHYLATAILPHLDNPKPLANNFVAFLDDYTTDNRGDIGSLIRREAINGVNIILKKGAFYSQRPTYIEDLMKCVVRLAAEKLDKVRLHAWKCLQAFWASATDLPPLQTKYDHFNEVSSREYFLQLLQLLSVDWLRFSLLKGLTTSVSAGTEGLIRASRSALVEYINAIADAKERLRVKEEILKDLVTLLEIAIQDDRYAIPAVDMLSFLLDTYFNDNSLPMDVDYKKLFVLTQKFHFKSSSILRIDAAIRLYASLRRIESIRGVVTKKLTSLLLHPYPKVRIIAAENLFVETGVNELKIENWTTALNDLKPTVEKIRGILTSVED
ncbi:hypothetical protein VTO42DRAFT_8918 [Malbranchea cinnamomea]